MKLVCLLTLVAMARANKIQFPDEWSIWKSTHSKSYMSEEEEILRNTVWVANKKYIENHNGFSANKTGFTLAMNQFGDLTSGEFLQFYTHKKHCNCSQHDRKVTTFKSTNKFTLPTTVDWRTKDAVTPVKNQGQCSSSYAFSAVGALEGAHALAFDKLVPLSEQNVVDCSVPYGNNGCDGGSAHGGFEYVIDNQGIDTEDSYPYSGKRGQCHYNSNSVGATQAGIVKIPEGSEDNLQSAVATAGPVSASIDGTSNAFRFYAGGVFDEPNCSTSKLTHSVLIIGYGTFKDKDYWLVKNSWGTQWGKDGYIMMSRNRNNQCGIATDAAFPTL